MQSIERTNAARPNTTGTSAEGRILQGYLMERLISVVQAARMRYRQKIEGRLGEHVGQRQTNILPLGSTGKQAGIWT